MLRSVTIDYLQQAFQDEDVVIAFIIRSKPSTPFVNSLWAYSSNLFRITLWYPNRLGPTMTSTILNSLIHCWRSLWRLYGRRLTDTPGFSLSLMLLTNCKNIIMYIWSKWFNLYPILSIWWSHHIVIPWNGFIVECDKLLTTCYKNPYNIKSSQKHDTTNSL